MVNDSSKMDILKIFRMQEPVSKELLSKNSEIGQYREVVQEKDVLLKNNRVRIKELEQQVVELEIKNRQLEHQGKKITNMDENEFQKVMKEYDKFIQKIWDERQQYLNENTTLKSYIQNMEVSFGNLLEKYEKARTIVQGFKENEDALKSELEEYTQVIEALENRYVILKKYSESKIAEANMEVEIREKSNLQEVAQLKVKMLQRQAKINELQKKLKSEDFGYKQSMFAPLKSNIPKV